MEKKIVLNGEKTCKICCKTLPISNFYFFVRHTYLNHVKTPYNYYYVNCKSCNNKQSWEQTKQRKLNGITPRQKVILDTVGKLKEEQGEPVALGFKDSPYYEDEFGYYDLLDELLNLKFTDIPKNELTFYRKYERNFRRNIIKNNISNGCSSNKACIRRFETHFRLSRKTKSSYKSMLDSID